MAEQALAEALDHLVRGISAHPDQVRVDSRDTGRGEALEVRVHPNDLGRVIGRGGRTASSLRTVVSALSEAGRVRVDVIDTDVTGNSANATEASDSKLSDSGSSDAISSGSVEGGA